MKYSKLAFLATALSMAQASTAFSQAAPDTCAGDPDADAWSCAQDAMSNDDWPAFLKWAQKAASEGDYHAADRLGDVYESGRPGISKDVVRAYMWYDIGAQLHAKKIRQLSKAQTYAGDNRQEIRYRDDVGRHLTPDQIAEALQVEREWLSDDR